MQSRPGLAGSPDAREPTAGASVHEGIVGSRGCGEDHFRLRTLASTLGGDMSTTVKSKRTASRTTNGRESTAKPNERIATAPQSAAAPSPFTPIADYGFLSDCHTGALVA